MKGRCKILTIGHSNHSMEVFLNLLSRHAVSAIADVRSVPFSRRNPQYSRQTLEPGLRNAGISYVFLGRELGGRTNDPSCCENGRVQFARLAERPEFRQGIDRLVRGSDRHRIALVCAEKEPLDCHRTLLVSEELERSGLSVGHIHSDGELECHQQAMARLPGHVGLKTAAGQQDLFLSSEELIDAALAFQEERIAYRAGGRAAQDAEKLPRRL